MISVSCAIMAHPKRRRMVDELREKLDRDAPVVWDKEDNRWDTGRRSMLAHDPDCTHHAVLQDDTLIPQDLIAGVEKALGHIPADAPLCGYIGRRRPKAGMIRDAVMKAETAGASWITMHTLNWGPLIVVPTAAIEEMLAHCDPLSIQNYDRRISRYWEYGAKARVWYPWPCLVDHADGPSLVPGRIGTDRKTRLSRTAHSFVGEDSSALDVDWSGPVIEAEPTFASSDRATFRHVTNGVTRIVPAACDRAKRLRRQPMWEEVT